MAKVYISEGGDRCDSEGECLVINNLISRGIEYLYHPGPFEYHRNVRSGYCRECGSDNVRKGAMYSPDLQILSTGVIIEIKGGSTQAASRSRLRDFVKCNPEVDLRFMFRDNRKIKGTKMYHKSWAEKLGCPVHIGMTVPESWV